MMLPNLLTISELAITGYLSGSTNRSDLAPVSSVIRTAANNAINNIVARSFSTTMPDSFTPSQTPMISDGKWILGVHGNTIVSCDLLSTATSHTSHINKTARANLGWSYIKLPKNVRDAMKLLRDKIDKDDLGEDGKETHPHITAKYGLVGTNPEDVMAAVKGNRGGKVRMGKTSLFHQEDGDVLKISVTSHALHNLWKSLSTLENEDKFTEYVPHSTLAYLKPGAGKKYSGDSDIEGMEFTFDSFVFEDKNDVATEISLNEDMVKNAQAEIQLQATGTDNHSQTFTATLQFKKERNSGITVINPVITFQEQSGKTSGKWTYYLSTLTDNRKSGFDDLLVLDSGQKRMLEGLNKILTEAVGIVEQKSMEDRSGNPLDTDFKTASSKSVKTAQIYDEDDFEFDYISRAQDELAADEARQRSTSERQKQLELERQQANSYSGDLDWNDLTNLPDGVNPYYVEGNFRLNGLTSIPQGFNPTIGGDLWLNGLTRIPSSFNPTVGGNLWLEGLKSIPSGFNPTVGANLCLNRLTSIPSGFNPTVGGSLWLRGLTSIPSSFNPTVGGGLWLVGLTSIPSGFNPTVGGDFWLGNLTSIPSGFNPTVGGGLCLDSLTSIPSGFNPTVGGDFWLGNLTSIPSGFNPTVGGGLFLHGLTSIPSGFNPTVGGDLYLRGLTSIPDSVRQNVTGKVYLNNSTLEGLARAERTASSSTQTKTAQIYDEDDFEFDYISRAQDELAADEARHKAIFERQKQLELERQQQANSYSGDLDWNDLTNLPDGVNPYYVEGNLWLRNLTSIPSGFNPTVGGNLCLNSLTSIPDGFNPTVRGDLWLEGLTSIPSGFNPTVRGDLWLEGLTSIPSGFNPTVGEDLRLDSLTSIPDGFNPTVGGGLYLGNLTSIPSGFNPTVGGNLCLNSLTSIPDSVRQNVTGKVYLKNST